MTKTEDFMTTKEVAEKWNISVCQAQNHCKNGRIKDVLRVGRNYLIPKDAMKPIYTYVYYCVSIIMKQSVKSPFQSHLYP